MKFGTLFEQGDILIVPFPFSNLRTIRQRPVLVISADKYNKSSEDIIVCGITSNLKDVRCSVLLDDGCLLKGKLPVKSRIKVDKLFTIDKSIIKKNIAKINRETFEKVKEEFFRLV